MRIEQVLEFGWDDARSPARRRSLRTARHRSSNRVSRRLISSRPVRERERFVSVHRVVKLQKIRTRVGSNSQTVNGARLQGGDATPSNGSAASSRSLVTLARTSQPIRSFVCEAGEPASLAASRSVPSRDRPTSRPHGQRDAMRPTLLVRSLNRSSTEATQSLRASVRSAHEDLA